MGDIKEQVDKFYQAQFGEDAKSTFVEAITSMDKYFNSKIAEQKAALEKAQQTLRKEILYLRIFVVVLSILLLVYQCQQIAAHKSMNAQIQEYNQTVEQNTQIIKENNRLIEEIASDFQKKILKLSKEKEVV